MSLRKTRSDAVLRNLPDEVRDELVRRLVDEGQSYAEARDWLAAEHRVNVSLGTLGAFWYSDCVRVKLTKARAAADSVKDALHDARPDFDKAAAGALAQRVFELAAAPGVAAADLTKLIAALNDTRRLEAKFEELELAKRRVGLLEQKQAEAKAKLNEALAKGAGKGGLSAEALKLIEEAAKVL